MKKLKVLLSTVLLGGLLLCVGFTNGYAKENSELNREDEITSTANIPLTINLSPQNVTKSGVTSHTVQPRINWYDGVSNSFTVGYHNAYGQKQLDRTFTNYSVTVQSTTYSLASGQT